MKFENIDINELLPDAKNPRKDLKPDDPEFNKIATSIEKFGFLEPIVFNTRTKKILGGHQRIKTLKHRGVSELHIIKLGAYSWGFTDDELKELTPSEENAANIALNKAQGDWDMDQLMINLQELKDEDFDIELTGFDDEEFDDMLKELHKGDEVQDAEPQVNRAEELQKEWHTELGQMWLCGAHRVMCGDCTDPAVVARVMGDEKADLVFTSPPYNQGGKGKRLDPFYGGKGDNKTKGEYADFIKKTLFTISTICKPDTPVLWNVFYNANSRDDYGKLVFAPSNPFTVKETIIWNKKHGFNISSKGILSRDSELIFLMSMGDSYTTNQGKFETWFNTWEIGTLKCQTEGHGAGFPVELPSKGITSFCVGSVVLDPFLGSGTTMIACENLGRKCRGCEIDPGYVAVILQRYKDTFPDKEIKLL